MMTKSDLDLVFLYIFMEFASKLTKTASKLTKVASKREISASKIH